MSQNNIEGMKHLINNEIDAAQHFFELELVDGPETDFAHAGLAICWAIKDNLLISKQEAMKSLSTTPTFAIAYVALGMIADIEKNTSQAEANFCKALEVDPNSDYVRYMVGSFWARSGKLDESIKTLIEVTKSNSSFWMARRNLAIAYLQKKQYARAFHEALEALRTKPSRSNAKLAMSTLLKAYPLVRWLPIILIFLFYLVFPSSVFALFTLAAIFSALYVLNAWLTKERWALYFAILTIVIAVIYYFQYIR